MKCNHCFREISDTSVFCTFCGKPVQASNTLQKPSNMAQGEEDSTMKINRKTVLVILVLVIFFLIGKTSKQNNHIWYGNVHTGIITCSDCGKTLSDADIRAKEGANLDSVEKARIYWALNENLTALKSDGTYLYSVDKAYSLVEKQFGVTKEYLNDSIWNGHAHSVYEQFYTVR